MSSNSKRKIDPYPLLLIAIALAGSLPFLGHAFHIYEPLFLESAEHLAANPRRPYDFAYLWGSDYQAMWQILNFPPLFAYYLAAVRFLAGPLTETVAHAAVLPFSVLAVLAFYGVCRRTGMPRGRSFLAAACLAASPAFVVSANLATPDMASLALALAAWYLADRGWRENRWELVSLAGLVLGWGCLARYNLVWLLPVFALLGWTYRAGFRALLPSLIASCLFLGWLTAFFLLYRSPYALEVLGLVLRPNDLLRHAWSTPIHLALAGGVPVLAAGYAFRKSPFWLLAGVLLTGYAGLAFYLSRSVPYFGFFPDALFFGLGAAAVAALGWPALRRAADRLRCRWRRERTADGFRWSLEVAKNPGHRREEFRDLVVVLWFGMALFFPSYSNLFPNKFLLLGIPPLLWLLFKYLPELHAGGERHLRFALPCVFLLSLAVARADFNLAEAYRHKAEALAASFPPDQDRKVWFVGHWGWQYYMERKGFTPLSGVQISRAWDLYPGDWVIGTRYNSPQSLPQDLTDSMTLLERQYQPSPLPLRTMNSLARAGLHSDLWGPLPFALSRSPLERFSYYLFQGL